VGKSDQIDVLGVTDLRVAFESFEAADLLRLNAAGRYFGWKCQTDGAELLGEAVVRALNGTRRCPRHVAATTFLIGVMKSLASEIIEKRGADPLSRIVADDTFSPDGLLASEPTPAPNPEDALAIKEAEEGMAALVMEIESLFADDAEALTILRGEMNGLSAEEIREDGAIKEIAYNSARRRIRRRIDKAYPNGWNR
jgi:DNA-directed RNA polymerase specialized sigma24 family protein